MMFYRHATRRGCLGQGSDRSLGRFFRQGAAGAVFCLVASLASADEGMPERIGFNEHIRPILTQRCTECHGGVQQLGGLSFVYPEQVLPPEGWVVEPGKPDESILLERVASDDPDLRMPPSDHGPPLSKREIELLRRWIAQGAKWEQHWAFEVPQRVDVPQVEQVDWCRNAIDRFVVARLDDEGISVAAEARPQEWLRRVTFDLTGLPPTPEELDQFLADVRVHGETAYEEVVQRLLDTPHFGERWASVWFDQVRYADSKGIGYDNRRSIWKYRDWVIEAFNADMPFNQFTIKQLAGDLLPDPTMEDLVATASHRLTQSNDEGGTDDEEFRIEAVLDRASTTWQAWQGVTFSCAQCHDHPYDPIRHEEFYQFVAFFNNTRDSDIREEFPLVEVPLDRSDYPRARQLDRQIEALQRKIWQQESRLLEQSDVWKPITAMEATSSNSTRLAVATTEEGSAEFHTVGTVEGKAAITLTCELPTLSGALQGVRLTLLPHDPETARHETEWGFMLSHVELRLVDPDGTLSEPLEIARVLADEFQPFIDPQQSLNPDTSQGFSAYTKFHHPRTCGLVLKNPVEVSPGSKLQIVLRHDVKVVSAFDLVSRRGQVAVSAEQVVGQVVAEPERQREYRRLAKLEQRRSKIPSVPTPVMQEVQPNLRRPNHVFIRGSFITKDLESEVEPEVPAAFGSIATQQGATRLDMAEWLVSDDNPLTSRVMVNRVWARLFGVGLVMTEEDFGSSGEPPSHPELLDYLALRYQHELEWSTKSLLRELVLSSTYRQSAKFRKELGDRDPNNRLLARGPRVRLPAEAVRDQALVVSGLFTPTLYGSPVFPPLPEGVWKPFGSGDKWTTAKRGDPDRYRRAIYTYTKRSIPFPMASAFDAPSRETCTPRRLDSNTPLQALITLNNDTMTEFSKALARRMMREPGDLRSQLEYGFLLVTSRRPTTEEVDDIEAFYRGLPADKSAGSRMTLVASALLNLDEALNK